MMVADSELSDDSQTERSLGASQRGPGERWHDARNRQGLAQSGDQVGVPDLHRGKMDSHKVQAIRLTDIDARRRIHLAQLIIERALEHCSDLGVTVQIRGNRKGIIRRLTISELYFHHPDKR
jgi:hypothetical protein